MAIEPAPDQPLPASAVSTSTMHLSPPLSPRTLCEWMCDIKPLKRWAFLVRAYSLKTTRPSRRLTQHSTGPRSKEDTRSSAVPISEAGNF